jgi:hypothetical protein
MRENVSDLIAFLAVARTGSFTPVNVKQVAARHA